MALKRRNELKVMPPGSGSSPGVHPVPVDARELVVFTAAQVRELLKVPAPFRFVGSLPPIIWLEPPAEVSDAEVQALIAEYRRIDGGRVVVLPRENTDRDLPREQVEQAAAAFGGGASQVRAVVAELLRDARVDDATRERAAELVEEHLKGAGL